MSEEQSKIREVFGAERDIILAAIKPKERNFPFIWEIESEGVKSYVVGTKHNENPDEYVASAQRQLQGIEQVLLELDPKEPTDTESNEFYQGLATQVATLSKQEQLALVSLMYAIAGKNIIAPLKPNPTVADFVGGVDLAIYESALKLNIPVHGLETQKEHLDAVKPDFAFLTPEALKEFATNESARHIVFKVFETAARTYQAADDSYFIYTAQHSKGRKTIITRNGNMAERSLDYLRKPTLIAVGALHCFGPASLLDLYETAGISVKRV